ncbi:hypothetical protein ACWIG5_30500 [Streptomyces lydicus]
MGPGAPAADPLLGLARSPGELPVIEGTLVRPKVEHLSKGRAGVAAR